MDYFLLGFKIIASVLLIGIAIYSMIYFSQINRVEEQFGVRIPNFIKKILEVLTMIPMGVSIAVLIAVLLEVINY